MIDPTDVSAIDLGRAFAAGAPSPRDARDAEERRIVAWEPWTMSGQPAIALPCSVSASGLPIGPQIVGLRFADHEALRLAAFREGARGFSPDWPIA